MGREVGRMKVITRMIEVERERRREREEREREDRLIDRSNGNWCFLLFWSVARACANAME